MDFVIIHHFDIWKDPIFVVYENHPSSHASFGFAIKILGMLLKEKRKKKGTDRKSTWYTCYFHNQTPQRPSLKTL